jgi:predicted nucleic acid-binding protein
MHEVVLDTNVLVSALRSRRGASYELLRSIDEGLWRPNIPVALALEYEDVLKRSDLVVGFSETEIEYFLDYSRSGQLGERCPASETHLARYGR